MSFNKNNNLIINTALFLIAVGLLIASGSFYRFIYSYNLIMFGVLALMCGTIYYRFFIPSDKFDLSNSGINYSGLLLLTIFIFIPIISDIYNQVVSYEITYFAIVIMILTLFLGHSNRKKIFKYYLLLIVILSSISLIYFTIELFSEIPSSFPYWGITKKAQAHFYYVWSGSANKYAFVVRNQSIFWEPGAFGFHLIIATSLAYKYKNKLFIFILLLTALTTLSTTVYIFIGLIFIYQIISGENRIKFIGYSILLIVIILLSVKLLLGNLNIIMFIYKAVSDKFSISSVAYQSFSERMLYTSESFKLFLDNIFIGAGHYSSNEELENIISTTSGLTGLLAELGLLGVTSIILYILFYKHFNIFSIPIALVWLNGEFMQYTPIAFFILTHMIDEYSMQLFPSMEYSTNMNDISRSRISNSSKQTNIKLGQKSY